MEEEKKQVKEIDEENVEKQMVILRAITKGFNKANNGQYQEGGSTFGRNEYYYGTGFTDGMAHAGKPIKKAKQ